MAAISKTSFTIHDGARLRAPLSSSTTKPVLYTHTLCPYAQRVFLTMLLKVCVGQHQGLSLEGV